MASLTWQTAEGERRFRLGVETRIGRAPQNDICISDAGVSGVHARIVRQGAAWILEDCGSRNGTFVNDEQQKRCVLRDGDLVGIGNADLTFHSRDTADDANEEMLTDASTILWRKGDSVAPAPQGAASKMEGDATRLRRLVRTDVDYNAVGSVDSLRYTTMALPQANEDPRQLARRLLAAYEISRATTGTLGTSEILDRVLGALFEIFGVADRAFIVLVDPQSREVHTAAARCRIKGRAADAGISHTALERAMRERAGLLCRDAAADERFAGSQSIVGLGIRSMMIAPLVFRDEVLGAVHIDTLKGMHSFTQADLELLTFAANQVAGCLANARLHEKVVASERLAAVGQTLAGLTHCIKNILQGIKGGAYILDKGLHSQDMARIRTGWEMVSRNNSFMEDLVWDLLTYSKQRQPEYAEADLGALCSEICELTAARAENANVTFSIQLDPALGPVEVDPRGIRRCLLNIITNAIDACAASGGTVTVRTQAPTTDPFVRVTVSDTGCGMSPETLAKLFTVFFSTKGSKGTGLGLPVTQKIIEEHGGRIDVASEIGKGTSFTLCLPLRRQRDTQKV
ncbi:MAG TPA: ATP-binding protein [Planctomycetota bacterium]|nr:ATP-binding protein [Planctomycetota bacterium]HRR80537.1 ATP-binding protein [Planctomycetota bacterium]HRT94386.1 ATP-binding protein [Planctomycetota bacterium]